MDIDVLRFTDEQYSGFNYDQKRILYEAQLKKNELQNKLKAKKENAFIMLLAMGTSRSLMKILIEEELANEYRKELKNLQEITQDAIAEARSSGVEYSAVPDGSVDYDPENRDTSLSYEDRMALVYSYYMTIDNAYSRYHYYFLAETGLKEYLGEYYDTLKYILRSYTR